MDELLQIGDQHLDSVSPSSRKDDYFAAICKKLEEVREIAHSRKVAAACFMGDLIHKQDGARVPYHLATWLISYFKSWTVPVLLGMGNHDIKSKAGNWRRQPIGTIVESGCVTPLWTEATTDNPFGEVAVRVGKYTVIHGKLFDYEGDAPENRPRYYAVEKSQYPDLFHVMVAHTALIPDGQTFFGHWTNPSDLAQTIGPDLAADFYLCGHIHDDLGSYGKDHIRAMNNGALARGTIDEFNLRRKVKLGLLQIGKANYQFTCKSSAIELQSARPADEIFYVKELTKKKARNAELEGLAEMLKQGAITDEFKLVDPDQALEVVLKSQVVRPEVEKRVREHVMAAREELG
jgi:DNA repair exonuclease SbcCD nuclease subunit